MYDRIYADDLIALRESSSAINNAKRQNTLSSLEGLKKTVLKLRDKLTFENIKANMISSKGKHLLLLIFFCIADMINISFKMKPIIGMIYNQKYPILEDVMLITIQTEK